MFLVALKIRSTSTRKEKNVFPQGSVLYSRRLQGPRLRLEPGSLHPSARRGLNFVHRSQDGLS